MFSVNALLNGLDLICIMPPGSGKTLVIYLLAACLRKIHPNSLVLVGMPFPAFPMNSHQQENKLGCKMATLSMLAQRRGNYLEAVGEVALGEVGDGPQQVCEADVLKGNFSLLFSHPEAMSSEAGHKLFRALAKKGFIKGKM